MDDDLGGGRPDPPRAGPPVGGPGADLDRAGEEDAVGSRQDPHGGNLFFCK